MKNRKDEISEIEMLENKLSKKLVVYKDFKDSSNNENYFNNLYYEAINKKDERKNRKVFSFNPAVGYAMMLFIVSLISFKLINFNNEVTLDNNYYLFSETSLWIEEEIYFSGINSESDLDLDYESYLSDDISIVGNGYFSDDIYKLAENNFDDIYNNIKNKKIL